MCISDSGLRHWRIGLSMGAADVPCGQSMGVGDVPYSLSSSNSIQMIYSIDLILLTIYIYMIQL